MNPSDPEVLAVERKRGSGPVRSFRLTAAETTLDLGGRTVRSWAYGDSLPGREVRIKSGDILDLNLTNHLPVSTTLHSHGVRMRCDMDGVPGLTQHPIRPATTSTTASPWTTRATQLAALALGLQLDRGLYAPLIVEDPREPLSYDKEWVVILDDWVDGVAGLHPTGCSHSCSTARAWRRAWAWVRTTNRGKAHDKAAHEKPHGPSRVLRILHSRILHSEGGSVDYPFYLVNGRLPKAPSVFRARKGDRIRLRIINAWRRTKPSGPRWAATR